MTNDKTEKTNALNEFFLLTIINTSSLKDSFNILNPLKNLFCDEKNKRSCKFSFFYK